MFQVLKDKFISAPVLTLPDASDVGVGAVLSLSSVDGQLHSCAFLSKKLSESERNYDIGNPELLAVKVALDEWRH